MTTLTNAPAARATTASAARIESGIKVYGEGDTQVRALNDVDEGFAGDD